MKKIKVALRASDPLSETGLAAYLQSRSELVPLSGSDIGQADVLVASFDRFGSEAAGMLRRVAATIGIPVVLVIREIAEKDLLTAVECRVVAILPRASVTAERLVHGVLAAADGGGVMPPSLVGELLKHIERLQRDVLTLNGLTPTGLSAREIDVLRLMADGLDTNEFAQQLCYSERTVKNVLYGMTSRLKLRNRSHAIAYAMRAGIL